MRRSATASNAKGGESGPDLIRAVPVIDDENGNLIGPIVLGGRQAQGMPKFNMTQAQISDIAAFLHEGVRAAAERGTYKILNIVTGNAEGGRGIFQWRGQMQYLPFGRGRSQGHRREIRSHHAAGKVPDAGGRQGQPAPDAFADRGDGHAAFRASRSRARWSGSTISTSRLTDANGDYHSFSRNGEIPKVELQRSHSKRITTCCPNTRMPTCIT